MKVSRWLAGAAIAAALSGCGSAAPARGPVVPAASPIADSVCRQFADGGWFYSAVQNQNIHVIWFSAVQLANWSGAIYRHGGSRVLSRWMHTAGIQEFMVMQDVINSNPQLEQTDLDTAAVTLHRITWYCSTIS